MGKRQLVNPLLIAYSSVVKSYKAIVILLIILRARTK